MKSAVVNGLFAGLLPVNTAFATDPLPSWNDGPAKQSTAIYGVRPRNRASVFHTAASSSRRKTGRPPNSAANWPRPFNRCRVNTCGPQVISRRTIPRQRICARFRPVVNNGYRRKPPDGGFRPETCYKRPLTDKEPSGRIWGGLFCSIGGLFPRPPTLMVALLPNPSLEPLGELWSRGLCPS